MTPITESSPRSADIQVGPEDASGLPPPDGAACVQGARRALLDEISITIAFALLGFTWITLRGMDGREGRRSRR